MGTLVISFAISAVLSLAYEMPFMVLDRVLLPGNVASARPKQLPVEGPASPLTHLSTSASYTARPAAPPRAPPSRKAAAPAPACSVATVESLDGLPDLHGYDNAAFERLAEK